MRLAVLTEMASLMQQVNGNCSDFVNTSAFRGFVFCVPTIIVRVRVLSIACFLTTIQVHPKLNLMPVNDGHVDLDLTYTGK